ncbi:MAG: BrnT family toxin [Bacteroidota bacterium]
MEEILKFEWSNNKASLNLKQHNVTFEEASTVFYNPLAKIFDDSRHSLSEVREIIIGNSIRGRLLFVAFTERKNSIRIFSARKVTKRERKEYEENNRNEIK